jgi:hypothetical protein
MEYRRAAPQLPLVVEPRISSTHSGRTAIWIARWARSSLRQSLMGRRPLPSWPCGHTRVRMGRGPRAQRSNNHQKTVSPSQHTAGHRPPRTKFAVMEPRRIASQCSTPNKRAFSHRNVNSSFRMRRGQGKRSYSPVIVTTSVFGILPLGIALLRT